MAVIDQAMVAINHVMAVISHVGVQITLRGSPKEQEDYQITHHLTQGTVDLQHHIADK